jgi:hypothetical protein
MILVVVFCIIKPCRLRSDYQHFEDTTPQTSGYKMEVVCYFKILISIQQIMLYHNPQDGNVNQVNRNIKVSASSASKCGMSWTAWKELNKSDQNFNPSSDVNLRMFPFLFYLKFSLVLIFIYGRYGAVSFFFLRHVGHILFLHVAPEILVKSTA